MLDPDLTAVSDQESCNQMGNMSDSDFNKYFDSDDQELLEAMKSYEVDVNVDPEWFIDLDEAEFCELPKSKLNDNTSTSNNASQNNGGRGTCCMPAANDSSPTPSTSDKSKIADAWCSEESYVDPSWFDEDLT